MKERDLLEHRWSEGRINLNELQRNWMGECKLRLVGSFCEHCNKPLDFMEFLDQISDSYLLKKDCTIALVTLCSIKTYKLFSHSSFSFASNNFSYDFLTKILYKFPSKLMVQYQLSNRNLKPNSIHGREKTSVLPKNTRKII